MSMHAKDLQVIQDLMQELQEKMSYGAEDFEERLGRKKPEVEVLKVEGKMPMEGKMPGDDEMPSEEEGMEVSGDDSEEMDFEKEETPEEKLKSRLMRLRG